METDHKGNVDCLVHKSTSKAALKAIDYIQLTTITSTYKHNKPHSIRLAKVNTETDNVWRINHNKLIR